MGGKGKKNENISHFFHIIIILMCYICRCYYRCTYHSELNCNATKQVEQCTDDDPPMYKVTYFNEHTCNDISFYNTTATNNWQQMLDFSVKETSEISVQRQQYLASSSDF
jgi:WRKY DNA -binding domain